MPIILYVAELIEDLDDAIGELRDYLGWHRDDEGPIDLSERVARIRKLAAQLDDVYR